MADNALPALLQRLLYAPQQGQAETEQLRRQYAGNPQMQQRLAVDNRYHMGRGMMQDSPTGALAAMLGSIPYDAAKLAYFHGPQPVKEAVGNVSERLFPGEGFNDQTTSRPDVRQYLAMRDGMVAGGYDKARDGLSQLLARWR